MSGAETDAPATLPPSLTIAFPEAIKVGAAVYAQIDLREPSSGEVLLAEKHLRSLTAESVRQYQTALIAKVSGVPDVVVNRMPVSLFNQAAAYLQNFIVAGRATGES